MAGESHRLSGVKRNYSFVFNGQSTVEGVYICVPHDSCSCTAHSIRDQRLEGRLAAIAFLQSFLFFCPREDREKEGLTCKELLMLLLTLSIYVWVF